jgi:hypothetical protein
MGSSDRSAITLDVLAYLTKNAEAGDTFDGIVEWWLLDRKIRQGIDDVREALDELAAKQLIREYQSVDARIHYRINRRKEKEIRALLERKG